MDVGNIREEHEKIDMKFENIAKVLKTNKGTDIDVLKNQDMKFLKKNKSETIDDNQEIDEDLSKTQEFEFVELEDEKRCENSVSDRLICNDALLEPDGFEFLHCLPDISNSSPASESFVVLESEGFASEEFEYDDKLKEESNVSLKDWNVTDNNITVDDLIGREKSLSITKHFDDNVKINSDGNSVLEQDGFISLSVEDAEIIQSFLKKLENGFLKQEKKKIKNQCSSKLDENETMPEACKTWLESSRKSSIATSNIESSDTCNERCHQSRPFTVECGLKKFKIKPNRNCSMESCGSNSAVNHPIDSSESLSRKLLFGKNRIAEYSHRSKRKSNADKTKAEEKELFINHIASCRKPDVDTNEKEEECYPKKHKKSKITQRKINDGNNQPISRYAAACSDEALKIENDEHSSKKSKKSKITQLKANGARNRPFINYAKPPSTLEMEKKEDEDFYIQSKKSLNEKIPVKKYEIYGTTRFMTNEMKRRLKIIQGLRRRNEREEFWLYVIFLIFFVMLCISVACFNHKSARHD